jgi:capsular exopolysaccharide synthesis family protein
VVVLQPRSAVAEAYRSLGTVLLSTLVGGSRVVTVTCPGLREGKSDVCANLAVVLAQAGNNILAIDCDFRKPQLHRHFGLSSAKGVMNMLTGEHSLQDVWQEPVERLKVVSTGSLLPDPAMLLGASRRSEFLASAREEFDYVLLDAPPIGIFSEAAILAAKADGVLLVLDEQHTDKASVRRSMRILEVVEANVLGTVVNNVKYLNDSLYQ